MKLIDENGNLFGKINIIDLLVILIAVLLVMACVYFYKEQVNKKELKERQARELVLKNVSILTGYKHTYGIQDNVKVDYKEDTYVIKEQLVMR